MLLVNSLFSIILEATTNTSFILFFLKLIKEPYTAKKKKETNQAPMNYNDFFFFNTKRTRFQIILKYYSVNCI